MYCNFLGRKSKYCRWLGLHLPSWRQDCVHFMGAMMVYMRSNVTITMASPSVNLGLVHNMRIDLSVLLTGSTSSDSGNSERLGFQVTYLFGLNWEKNVFFPRFLKFDHALSQSVEEFSPLSSSPSFCWDCRKSRLEHETLGRMWREDNVVPKRRCLTDTVEQARISMSSTSSPARPWFNICRHRFPASPKFGCLYPRSKSTLQN